MSQTTSLENIALNYPNMRVHRITLKAGEEIPIHMHTGQFGFMYLLCGKCRLTTYSIEELRDEQFMLTLDSNHEIIAHDYATLTPYLNAHQIHAIEDSVFLDIFAPGKDEGKLSDYLEIISSEQNSSRIIGRKMSIEDVKLPDTLSNNMICHTEIQ